LNLIFDERQRVLKRIRPSQRSRPEHLQLHPASVGKSSFPANCDELLDEHPNHRAINVNYHFGSSAGTIFT